jgi:transposase-like protein|tara:strand:+ start:7026 stop:7370 length:345 start_codon:yes stop_codon:yes gene_type:complete
MEILDINCPKCGWDEYSLHTKRRTKNEVHKVFRCKNCKRIFTPRGQFHRMRFEEHFVEKVLWMKQKGATITGIVRHFKENGIKISRTTIYKWTKKYGKTLTFNENVNIEEDVLS